MLTRYLSLYDVAERIGVQPGTIRAYSKIGMLPEPDAYTGAGSRAVRGWLPETIDAWNAARPGKGGRPKAKA